MNLESNLLGKSSVIKKLRKEIPLLAKADRILITGEKGSGKSLIARLIHETSRSKTRLIPLSPLTSSEQAIKESFEKPAANCTIVIQEIEGFSFLNQGIIARLTKHLEKKQTIKVIATAKKSINELRKEGILLDDLFGVLKTFDAIFIPPLSERAEDIPLLVEHFVKNACESVGTELKVLDVNALDFLVRREWKHNVLELKNVIEKSVLTSESEAIELPQHLIDEYAQLEGMISNIEEKKAFPFDKALSNLEKILIEKTMATVGYNQTKAAKILDISSPNFRYRLRKFKIPSSRKRKD
jgi:two-component system nitrogen regulation response regulator NtrX